MLSFYTTNWVATLGSLAILAFAGSCATSEAANESKQNDGGMQELPLEDYPFPTFQLTSYAGALCPPETALFRPGDGTFTFIMSVESKGEQSCELNLDLTIPAGYRFRRPLLWASGSTLGGPDEKPATSVELTYKLGAGPSVTSHHVVPTATSAAEIDYQLVDTPKLEADACSNSNEPSVVPFQLTAKVAAPEDIHFTLLSIDGNFHLGIEWFECSAE